MSTRSIAAALGLLLAIAFGMLALTQVGTLQTSGTGLGGTLGDFFGSTTTIWLALTLLVAAVLFVATWGLIRR